MGTLHRLCGPLAILWTVLTVLSVGYVWSRWLDPYLPWQTTDLQKMGVVAILFASVLRRPGKYLAIVLLLTVGVAGSSLSLSLTDAIARSFQEPYAVFQHIMLIQPAGRPLPVDARLRAAAAAGSNPVIETVDYSLRVPIFAEAPETLAMNVLAFGVQEADMSQFLNVTANRLSEGRLPAGAAPEIALSVALARKLGLGMGDSLRLGDGETGPLVRVVGLLDGGPLMSLLSAAYARQSLLPLGGVPDLVVLLADPAAVTAGQLRDALSGEPVRVWDFQQLSQKADQQTAGIRLLGGLMLLFGVGITVFLAVLLKIVAFEGRLGEYSLFTALGFARRSLQWSSFVEDLVQGAAGWALGMLCAAALGSLAVRWKAVPNGLNLSLSGGGWSALVPIAYLLAGLVVTGRKLRRLEYVEVLAGKVG